MLGVYDAALVEPLAQVLSSLGVKRGMVVHGLATLDELSTACDTKICEFKDGWQRTYFVKPEELGFARCALDDLKGGSAEENALITRDILGGTLRGCKRDTVVLNAAAGLLVNDKADTLEAGIELANELIDSGAALATLQKYIEVSNS